VARPKRKSSVLEGGQERGKPDKVTRFAIPVYLLLLLPALAVVSYLVVSPGIKPTASPTSLLFDDRTPSLMWPLSPDTSGKPARNARSLHDLLAMDSAQLAQVDIAEMNLVCATGLPGAENLDIDRCLATLDHWAAWVKHETDRHLYRFYQNPAEFNGSEGYFRMLMLITVLQQDCGVHYNLERVRDIDFTNSQDLFIHGMVGEGNGGTCASMPVLYTPVARRLGYPIKLVLAKAHVFCRWDGPKERVNIEGASRGMHSYDDEYYRTWPHKISDAEVQANQYLVSLSPQEELACFLASRGHCLLDNGRAEEAFQAYAAAHRLAPENPAYLAWAQQVERRLHPEDIARRVGTPRPPTVYRQDPLAEVKRINAINRARLERMADPGQHAPTGPQSR